MIRFFSKKDVGKLVDREGRLRRLRTTSRYYMRVVKLIVKGLAIASGLLMLIISCLSYATDMRSVLARDSASYLWKISSVNYGYSIAFFVGYVLVVVLVIRKFSVWKIVLLPVFFFLWLLSGRVVACKPWPEGHVSMGWFYMPAEDFVVCTGSVNCEDLLLKETVVTPLSFWRVNINNKQINKTIFVGPFTSRSWNETLGELSRYNAPDPPYNRK